MARRTAEVMSTICRQVDPNLAAGVTLADQSAA